MDISHVDQCAKSGHNKGDIVNTRDNNAPHECRANGTPIEVNRSWSTARAGNEGFPQSKTELDSKWRREIQRDDEAAAAAAAVTAATTVWSGWTGTVINQYILLTQWRNDVESPFERVHSFRRLYFYRPSRGYFELEIARSYPVRASVSGLINARHWTECLSFSLSLSLSARESAKLMRFGVQLWKVDECKSSSIPCYVECSFENLLTVC